MQEAASLCGALYECPACGRVLWRLPDEETWRVYERRASERDLRTVVDEAGDATGAPGT